MEVVVKRGNVIHTCRTEEHLQLFLEAGYEVVKPVEDAPAKVEKPKRKTTKK